MLQRQPRFDDASKWNTLVGVVVLVAAMVIAPAVWGSDDECMAKESFGCYR